METFYDGYVVNAIMDAAYKSARSKQWEPVELEIWRGSNEIGGGIELQEFDTDHFLVKEEIMPDGRTKLILKEKEGGRIVERVIH